MPEQFIFIVASVGEVENLLKGEVDEHSRSMLEDALETEAKRHPFKDVELVEAFIEGLRAGRGNV